MIKHLNLSSNQVRNIALAILYLLLTTATLSILFNHWVYDDPFITYRYANNLSRGLGLVYNPGERVLSTTTPLFALLLAIPSLILPDLHGMAIFIGSVSLAVGGLCLWDLATLPNLKFTRWVGLLFFPFFPLLASTLSSETPLYLALCLGAFAFYRRQRYDLAALLAALATLTRPDGVLVAVILGLHYLWTHHPKGHPFQQWLAGLPWRTILICLCTGLIWIIFAWIYYGSPIPVTLFAKQQQASVTGGKSFLPGFFTILSWYSSWEYKIQALLALPGLVFGLIRWSVFRKLAAWTCLYFLAYSLLGVTRYHWYYAPLIPAFILSFGLSLDGLRALLFHLMHHFSKQDQSKTITSHQRHIRTPLRWAAYWLPEALLVILLVFQFSQLWKMHFRTDTRFPIYQAVGEWLEENTPPEAKVGALEVGIIGYYAQRPMVDFSGLIQPNIAAQIGQNRSYSDTAAWAIALYRPNFLILNQDLTATVAASISPPCHLLVTFLGVDYNYAQNLNLYACP